MEFVNLGLDELMMIDGGVSWEMFWAGVGVSSAAIGLAVTIGKTVATAATVTAVAGLAAGVGIVVLGAVAAGGIAYSLGAFRN